MELPGAAQESITTANTQQARTSPVVPSEKRFYAAL